jgi:hypothetical protein
MRLDFNVLWVDDQPGRIESQIARIAKQMEEEGFQFNPKLCKTIDEVRGLVADHVFTDEIDLILVDWDLGGGAHGEDAIARIREAVPYKDVVFYSAQQPAAALRKLAFDSGIEGVYCASREELIDEVLGVFESLIKKVLDLDHTRGIVMGATSDIDHMVNECLIVIYERLDGTDQRALVNEALERIDKKLKDWTKGVEKLRKEGTMKAVLEAHVYFTANDRLRILSEVMRTEMFKAHARVAAVLGTYMTEVVPERNKLGHAVLVAKGKPHTVVNAEGEEVSLERMRDLRRVILRLRQDFRNLLDALRAQAEGAPLGPGPGSGQ